MRFKWQLAVWPASFHHAWCQAEIMGVDPIHDIPVKEVSAGFGEYLYLFAHTAQIGANKGGADLNILHGFKCEIGMQQFYIMNFFFQENALLIKYFI